MIFIVAFPCVYAVTKSVSIANRLTTSSNRSLNLTAKYLWG